MRIGIVTIPSAIETGSAVVDHVVEIAHNVEALGFHGLWVTDAFARGKPTLDPLILLGALATQTQRIELGTCVVQVPLRHPVEHAHRVQTLNALSKGRLPVRRRQRLHQARFRRGASGFRHPLQDIDRLAGGHAAGLGGRTGAWPRPVDLAGTEGGPPVLLGAWRSERWINLSAKVLQGWIASGIHSSWEDLEIGIKMFRAAGGKRAVLANIFTDFRDTPAAPPFAHVPKISLFCTPREAKERLKRLEDLGLDDALLVVPSGDPDNWKRSQA